MDDKTGKVWLRRLLSVPILLATLISGGILLLLIGSANTPDPDIPLYTGAHYINLPRTQNERKSDLRIVMEASGSEMDVYKSYSKLLNQHGWGNGMQCYSGIPGTWVWHRRGLLDPQGWAIHVEFRGINNQKTDIVVDVWRGFDTKITCGDL
jgi:hypothetical protein